MISHRRRLPGPGTKVDGRDGQQYWMLRGGSSDWSPQQHVDDHPPLVEPQILQRDVEMLAHEAVGAITAEQEARAQNLLPACGTLSNRHGHAVIVLGEVDSAPSEHHVHGRVSGHAGAEQLLELRLHEGDRRRPGQRMRRRLRLEFLDHPPIHAQVVRPGMRRGELGDALRQSASLEDAHDLMVEGQRARLVVDVELGFDHADAQPQAGEQIRQRGAHRPEADDEGIVGHLLEPPRAAASGCQCRRAPGIIAHRRTAPGDAPAFARCRYDPPILAPP